MYHRYLRGLQRGLSHQEPGAFPVTESVRGALSGLRNAAFSKVLDRSWDPMIYSCMTAGALTVLVCALFPVATQLAVFTWLMFFTSGPTATFLPSASEPILMAFGKLYPPIVLATLGVAGIALVEWVNYRVFGTVMHSKALTGVRSTRLSRRLTAWFAVQPFLTTVVAAFTPIPFWAVRICAVIVKYPTPRFIAATVVGRYPRIFLIASLGAALPLSSATILLGGGVLVLAGTLVAMSRRRAQVLKTAIAAGGSEDLTHPTFVRTSVTDTTTNAPHAST